jgi:hypothetical protein
VPTELRQASIVLLGSFNPVIFQPDWLSKEDDLLPADEFEFISKQGNLVVSSEWTIVQLKAVRFEVWRERWALITERPDWIKDLGGLARSIFLRLPETPVTRVGFNDVRHVGVPGNADAIIRRWVPLDDLGRVAGTKDVAVGAVARTTWKNYVTSMQFEKSVVVKNGLYLHQNFERDVTAKNLQDRLLEWGGVIERAEELAANLSRMP